MGPELEKKFPSSRGELEREKASKINIHLPAGGFFFFLTVKVDLDQRVQETI